ncbi:HNH endonuclease [Vibrio sinaloensis]|uniref:HNH endonuclease n=1 Tax=Photobacterium sp. (strain ATCC 43367) TaxID=379097 RepID=UPI00068D7F07|nr:HNH endonuclease signature motif containing protein [Vibrio sinaloensis]
MLGFPNQISNLQKVALSVEVFYQADLKGVDLKNDHDIGEMLLVHQVISPRNKAISLDEYLAEQRKKKRSNRSYETSARGIRELLIHLNILESDGNHCTFGKIKPDELYNHKKDKIEQIHFERWRDLFLNITLGEKNIHPYDILLRLVGKFPGINRKLSTLCFSVENNSEEEVDRIVHAAQNIQKLADSKKEKRNLEDIIAHQLGETSNNINNAAKILPAFAIQIGDLRSDKDHNLYLTEREESAGLEIIADLHDLETNDSLNSTERKVLSDARVGQGIFKKNVIKTWKSNTCALLNYDLEDILIASHIKAWKACETKDERLDGANGLLLSANVDKVFDKHLITFKAYKDEYKLTFAKRCDVKKLESIGLKEGRILNVESLSPFDKERFKRYMLHHNEIFDMKDSFHAQPVIPN